MNALDCLVLGALAAAAIGAILWIIRRNKRGGGACGSCPYRDSCGDKAYTRK